MRRGAVRHLAGLCQAATSIDWAAVGAHGPPWNPDLGSGRLVCLGKGQIIDDCSNEGWSVGRWRLRAHCGDDKFSCSLLAHRRLPHGGRNRGSVGAHAAGEDGPRQRQAPRRQRSKFLTVVVLTVVVGLARGGDQRMVMPWAVPLIPTVHRNLQPNQFGAVHRKHIKNPLNN